MSITRKHNRAVIGVVDIFAGPGGLSEGFSNFESAPGVRPFDVAVSAEMEASAHATLRLRAFLRLVRRQAGTFPREYYAYLEQVAAGTACRPDEVFGDSKWRRQWRAAEADALQLTLGEEADNATLYAHVAQAKRGHDEIILIGGPPCQAYSLVGRARQGDTNGFRTHGIPKHFLYKQYLRILADFQPAIFIMENVRGVLTSTVGGRAMFKAITRDLAHPREALAGTVDAAHEGMYELLPVHVPSGQDRSADAVADHPERFVVHCEDHGVPQARHRVLVMGVRRDFMRAHPGVARVPGLADLPPVPIEAALAGLPPLRSGVSREPDDAGRWRAAMERERNTLIKLLRSTYPGVASLLRHTALGYQLPRESTRYMETSSTYASSMGDTRQNVVLNHGARSHMQSDLGRYLFCAAFAAEKNRSPKAGDFPRQLAPDHCSWGTGTFDDRFRVQLPDRPSNTVTSHLSKDGHAFIHWDPSQCRSLTVREAARLQTFPDNYLFLGNRTQQYVQVGNAVPPRIAEQIARVVWCALSDSSSTRATAKR